MAMYKEYDQEGDPKRDSYNIQEDCAEVGLSVLEAYQLAFDIHCWRNTIRSMGCQSARALSSSPGH